MEQEKLISLIRQYINGNASADELAELQSYISREENAENISGALETVLAETGAKEAYDAKRFDPLLKNILEADKIRKVTPVRRLHPFRWAAAAAIIILFAAGGYFYFNKKSEPVIAKTEIKNDIAPGGNKAILTLANGQQIILNSAANGTITQQGNTKIIKLDSGQLAYQQLATGNGQSAIGNRQLEIQYNTISTPKGGQYQIVLADGSKVWLNSASSLRFPTAFNGKERLVELTGEGYFEVKHDARQPFRVKAGELVIEDIGTHFNINAYSDEETLQTTLLEGSIRVTTSSPSGEGRGEAEVRLKPGQQAILAENGQLSKINNVDINKIMAWKNGWFEFDQTGLATIMRQVSRWYDVDVIYEGNPGTEKFGGRISKNLPLSSIMNMLESSGVNFRLEGRKLVVKAPPVKP